MKCAVNKLKLINIKGSEDVQGCLISIIIPIYNAEKYLQDCLDSVIKQSYKNLDIILINDGSTDNSEEICEEYKNNDSRIRLINQKNKGAAMAKNVGLELIKGELFAFLDSDDMLHSNNLEILYTNMINTNADIIEGNFTTNLYKFNNKPIIKNSIDIEKTKTFTTEKGLEELIINGRCHQTPWNKLYKTQLLKGIIFPKGKYIDDEYWTYKLFLNANYISSLDLITYYYRQHDDSTMGKSYSVRRLDAIDALNERYLIIRERFPRLEHLALKSYLLCCIFNFQKLCLNCDLDKNKKYREDIINRFRIQRKNSKVDRLSIKEKALIDSFYKVPYMVSKIRNVLGRGT
ncbi:Glycosyltransferase involved in cell wall bisynthesis [Terrisporobacter glycolicus]|nr:Glycosyltransferase involved in cell wall bisynthesis [Terrisporobacter glycolicus]